MIEEQKLPRDVAFSPRWKPLRKGNFHGVPLDFHITRQEMEIDGIVKSILNYFHYECKMMTQVDPSNKNEGIAHFTA